MARAPLGTDSFFNGEPRTMRALRWSRYVPLAVCVLFGCERTTAPARLAPPAGPVRESFRTGCVAPPAGAIAWWTLDESSGTTLQDVVGGHTGTLISGAQLTQGLVGNAASFDGSAGYITVPDDDQWAFGSAPFSIELWAYFSSQPGGTTTHPTDIFIGNDQGPGFVNKWFFALGGGVLEFVIGTPSLGLGGFVTLAPFVPALGQWYHLVVVRSGSTYTVYINGKAAGSATNASVIPNTNAPLTIGQAENLGFVNGRLDEVTIYNRAITSDEVQGIYVAGSAGKCRSITSVLPNQAGNAGSVTVQIAGVHAVANTAVTLRGAGVPDIFATQVTVVDTGTIAATFSLSNAVPGVRDVLVTPPGGVTTTLASAFTVVSSAPSKTGCVAPPSGMLAWWPLDESSGATAQDLVGGHAGTFVSGAQSAPGLVGNSVGLNGSTSYVGAADDNQWAFGSAPFSIELWAYFTSHPGGSQGEPTDIFIGNDEGPGFRNKWFFALGGGVLEVVIGSPSLGGIFLTSTPFTPTLGQWYHLAVVRTGNTYTFYINGKAAGSRVNASAIPNPAAPLTIGQAENIGFVNGRLDEVTVYNRSLTPDEVQGIYGAGAAGKCRSAITVSPQHGGNSGQVTVHVTGVKGMDGMSLALHAAGQADIVATQVATVDVQTITGTFDLTGATTGSRDVVISIPGSSPTTLPAGFTIEPGGTADLWVSITGLGLIKPGQPQTFWLTYGNRGNVNAAWVPIWIAGIPSNATWALGPQVRKPSVPGLESFDWTKVPVSVPNATDVGIPFIVSSIPPGFVGTIQITLTVPIIENLKLRTWINSSSALPQLLVAAQLRNRRALSLRTDAGHGVDAGECVEAVAGLALQLLTVDPKTKCGLGIAAAVSSFLATMNDLIKVGTNGVKGSGDVYSLMQFWIGGTFGGFGATGVAENCGLAAIEGPFGLLIDIANVLQVALSSASIADACGLTDLGRQVVELVVTAIHSFDPNELTGPNGVGTPHFIIGSQPVSYAIGFENTSTATAPAQRVAITDQLSPDFIDLSTISFGPITFGTTTVIPPTGTNHFSTQIDLRPATNLLVKIDESLDLVSGLFSLSLVSIDPLTGNPPTDPRFGFLPPDVLPPQGDGSLVFTVAVKPGLATGAVLANTASIVFDANPAISTPTWSNTIDNTPPASRVQTLTATQALSTFNVSWSATDVGSGVSTFNVYSSDLGAPFTLWQSGTSATSGVFTGQPGHTYAFYSTALDLTGNLESKAPTAEAATRILGPFGWLAPLGTAIADPSSFDAAVTPQVIICVWTGSACTGSPIAQFATTTSPGVGALLVNSAAGDYEASWSLLSTAFSSRKTYRIRVLQGAAELGAISVDVVRGRWALTRPDGTLAPLVSANDLPIKFRMGGALSGSAASASQQRR